MTISRVWAWATTLVCGSLVLDQAQACSCFAVSSICDQIGFADVVVHATITDSEGGTTSFGDVLYTIETKAMYKGDPNVKYAQQLSVTTASNSAACGVVLEVGEDYLLGLSSFDGGLSVGLCSLIKVWDDVTAEDLATLENGCENETDPCGECGESQECQLYSASGEEEYFCADTCDPSPCLADETCSLKAVQCVRAPCPPVATCMPNVVEETCDPACKEFQECLLYVPTTTKPINEYYCADVCDPNPCAADEVCSLEEVQCVREPCPPVATCTPETVDDPCSGACNEFQECVEFDYGRKYYCSDTCKDGACEDGQTCTTTTRAWCRHTPGCPEKRSCR